MLARAASDRARDVTPLSLGSTWGVATRSPLKQGREPRRAGVRWLGSSTIRHGLLLRLPGEGIVGEEHSSGRNSDGPSRRPGYRRFRVGQVLTEVAERNRILRLQGVRGLGGGR